jgi:hypothetical protein
MNATTINNIEQRTTDLLHALYAVRCAADRGEQITHEALMHIRRAATAIADATLKRA